MKNIRIYMDYIPNHNASRRYSFELFAALHKMGIPCELAVFGFIRETGIIPEVRIISSPDQIDADFITFSEDKILDKLSTSDPKESNDDFISAWNEKVCRRRIELFQEKDIIHLDILDVEGMYAEIIKEGLQVTNAGGVKYFHLPVITTHNEYYDEFRPITELVTSPVESEFGEQEYSLEDTASLLKILSERALSPEDFREFTPISMKNLEECLNRA